MGFLLEIYTFLKYKQTAFPLSMYTTMNFFVKGQAHIISENVVHFDE